MATRRVAVGPGHSRHGTQEGGGPNQSVLELYQSEECPHSARVRETMSELGLSAVVHNPRLPGDAGGDVTNEQTHEELIALGGEDQIPLLVDHQRGETIAESDDILAYLTEHYE